MKIKITKRKEYLRIEKILKTELIIRTLIFFLIALYFFITSFIFCERVGSKLSVIFCKDKKGIFIKNSMFTTLYKKFYLSNNIGTYQRLSNCVIHSLKCLHCCLINLKSVLCNACIPEYTLS